MKCSITVFLFLYELFLQRTSGVFDAADLADSAPKNTEMNRGSKYRQFYRQADGFMI